MKFKLMVLALSSALAAPVSAVEPFTVRDIRVEGAQRTDPGTVFSYLPVKVGEKLDDDKAAAAVKALYATGFFKDVRLDYDNGVLVVYLEERPAISQIDVSGSKDFEKDKLKDSLKQIGLAESRIFDRALLEKAEQELKRQYFSRGKYGVEITTTVTPLERNRVAINFTISEGEVAKIKQINIVGNQAFPEKDLASLFTLTPPGWFTWYTKNDQYSKQKLGADLEGLRSFYLNRGYLEFEITSTQVAITPDKREIFITVNVNEGPKFTIGDVRLGGELSVPEEEVRRLLKVKAGDVFSRELLTQSSKAISDRLGNDGFAFANVNAVPEVNREKNEVSFTFFVDPGRRVYVRRINVTGNNKTRDEVVRREMRQMEGTVYALDKVSRSRERIDRLGYFGDVTVETPAVPGTTDQVDMNVNVVEKPTGSIMAGLGYGSSQGFLVSGSVTQNNVFGSGNAVGVQINSGKLNKVYSFAFTDPYYTKDGISRGFDVYKRNVDPSSVQLGEYRTSTTGVMMRYGFPVSEANSINTSLGVERTTVYTFDTSPQRYVDFVSTFGRSTTALLGMVGWSRDTRDSLLYTTRGNVQRISTEIGLPGASLKYYRLNYQHQYFAPLTSTITMMLNGEFGVGDGYGGKPLPFFKNFFVGGIGSVRGYESSSIGPRDSNNDPLGGNRRIVANAELLFPVPGMGTDKSVRMSAFVDGGTIYTKDQKLDFGQMRYSAGVAVTWISPVGPLKFSLAKPFKNQPDDRLQKFQFQMGSTF